MLLIPGSPHYQLLQSMHRLDSFSRTNPASPQAAQAFDEFLRIGHRAHLVEATLLSAIAAIAVAIIFVWLPPLSVWEAVFVVSGFAVYLTGRTGLRYFGGLDALGIGVFAAVIWIGRYSTRKRRPGPDPRPSELRPET
jgi:hypothetical protein